ncbi:mannose-6-phosphate isomerase, class I [Arthrobacter dokdonensis]|uniref:mannose-6-phosphate isomerase, class I n=1 Tax=Arthrobacter dokdonellae TaxID=2211210 RepID=UPI000DE5AFC5|nr:mannose-6-phosphate isomerase, class I [Arthrobacter dokdonellae]
MFVSIANDPKQYAWGSHSAVASILGREESGKPEAELWLGAHPASPARIVDPARMDGHTTLAEWIAADPLQALGPQLAPGTRLPFLLKVLAASLPLSLQAHPTEVQAAAGFERENAAGIPLDAPFRNYRDPHHKPELLVVLSETFEALCGFRSLDEVQSVVRKLCRRALGDPAARSDLEQFSARIGAATGLSPVVEWLLEGSPEVSRLVDALVHLATHPAGVEEKPTPLSTIRQLANSYPGDPGIVVSLLVNHVTLSRGDALYLPAGNIHAYLHGVGIELMAASDNVLRGGLTTKHVDVKELLQVLDFSPSPVPLLLPDQLARGVKVFRPEVADFQLIQADLEDSMVSLDLEGPTIIFVSEGQAHLEGSRSSRTAAKGEALYITPDEGFLTLAGSGQVFLATTGSPPAN